MDFTALHRMLGRNPGPITDEMIEAAIESGLVETDQLDWKSELPPVKGLTQTDYPKDIAAMANSGGGTIVYGVEEAQKAATGRRDTGVLDEGYERALRSAAVTGISPPIFGLGIHSLGEDGRRAVAVVVPESVDGPHLIYRGEYFGAPIRNDADTVWMKERQIEAMYRARFEERRHSAEAITNLYEEAAAGRDTRARSWLVAVAHPRLPISAAVRPTVDEARQLFDVAGRNALVYVARNGMHPFDSVDLANPRPGLRRWVAPNSATTENTRWREAWASIHHDGSVTITAAIGGHRSREGQSPGNWVDSAAIEAAVADFMGLLRAVSERMGTGEYEVRVGIEWAGSTPLLIQTVDGSGSRFDGTTIPLGRYIPVTMTVLADAESVDFYYQVHDLAEDCINQGGITNLRMIHPPARD